MNEVNDVSSLVDESGQAASGAMGTAAALARGPSPVHRAEGADVVSRRHGSHRHPARLCVAAPPGPASASSLHCAVDVPPGRDHLCRLCRTSLATSIQPAERSRRSHVYDVNPEQLRHVHKPPAHKSPKEPARLEAPDAQLTFCLRFSPGRRQLGRPLTRGRRRWIAPTATTSNCYCTRPHLGLAEGGAPDRQRGHVRVRHGSDVRRRCARLTASSHSVRASASLPSAIARSARLTKRTARNSGR